MRFSQQQKAEAFCRLWGYLGDHAPPFGGGDGGGADTWGC